MHTNDNNKVKPRIGVAVTIFVMILLMLNLHPAFAKADTASIHIKEINYANSTVTLQVNAADTKVYFSDSKKTDWEVIPGEINSDRTITLDISWIPMSKSYIISFKGDNSTTVVSVNLPKQVSNFKATYNKIKGTMSFINIGTRTIEWRKKDSSSWETVDTSTISAKMAYLYNNGATVYFRLAPVSGTSATEVGYRASKEIAVSIPKRTDAPNIIINGSNFSIPVKKGMAYRIISSDSSVSKWININNAADLLLEDIAAKVLYTGSASTQSEVTLQFRTNSTNSAQVSKITTLTVPVQVGPPSIDTYGMALSYTSSTTAALTVKAASASVPFEYTILKKDDELDYRTASWTAITSSAAANIDSKKAPEGSHIYVRLKSIPETTSTHFSLASKEIDITAAGGVKYPDAPEATILKTLITTAGVCNTEDSSSYLSFALYSATSTTVSSIKFRDAYGITKGTVTCKSTVAKNPGSLRADDKYIITTKITSTSTLDTITDELLYADITLANSDVITSSDTAGIRLYLYPASYINNPEKDDAYSQKFERVYLSKEASDDNSFKFQLDFGTSYLPDTSAVGTYTATATAIKSIKYDGYTLVNGTDYNVTYGSYINDNDKTVTKATVTVYVDKFEASSLIDTTDTVLPLDIHLNNGEVLDNNVFIKLVSTATMNNIPLAWSITEGSLKETETSKVTNSDNSTTTVIKEVISYTITLNIFNSGYSVGVSDVTWGGTSIFGSATISGGKATINLSNAKINKLSTNSSDTKNVVITLSNGFTISTGCKLTILNAS